MIPNLGVVSIFIENICGKSWKNQKHNQNWPSPSQQLLFILLVWGGGSIDVACSIDLGIDDWRFPIWSWVAFKLKKWGGKCWKNKNTMKYHCLLCIAAGLCCWCEGEVAIGPQLSGEGGLLIPDLGGGLLLHWKGEVENHEEIKAKWNFAIPFVSLLVYAVCLTGKVLAQLQLVWGVRSIDWKFRG